MSDPAFYKILALMQALVWGSFLIRYSLILHSNGYWEQWRNWRQWRTWRVRATFAMALLIIAVAVVMYSIATVLRQFLGSDYLGRDAVRILAATGFLVSGAVFHLVVGRESRRSTPNRRHTDFH